MKSTSLKKKEQSPHLKLIKNSAKKLKRTNPKTHINTLIPGFNYINSTGQVTNPSTHVII
jgi:hypothetical protein